METTTGEYTTYNIGMILIGLALLAITTALVAGGVIGFRKGRAISERRIASVAIVGGAAILSTLMLGVLEVLPETALWPLLFAELGTLSILFWVWMLVDCVTKEPGVGNDKLIWVLIILFTHVIGAGLYFLVRRSRPLAGEYRV